MKDYKFCPLCAARLELSEADGCERLNCPKCGWIHYQNPLPVVACLVSDKEGGLLLIKRDIEPCKGHWALPGGFIEVDESIQDAGARELLEETGLEGKPGPLVGAHVQISQMYGAILMVGFEFTVEDENPVPGDDASDTRFFDPEELPEIPFSSHRALISQYLRPPKGTVSL